MKKKKVYLGYDAVQEKMRSSPHSKLIQHQRDFFKNDKFTEDLTNNRCYYNCLTPSFPGLAWDRCFEGVKRIAMGEFVPLFVDLVVTGICHCKCWHCFRSDYSDQRELSLEIIGHVLSDAQDLGASLIGITGGEPLLRPDIMDILRMIPPTMEGLLYTTGINFNEEFVTNLAKTRVSRCLISLDHYEKEKVNNMRGYQHAYDNALQAIKLLNDANIYTGVTLCATEDMNSLEEFKRYLDFVYNLEAVDEIRIVLPIPQGNLKGKDFKKFYINVMRWTRSAKECADKDESYPNIFLFNQFESEDYLGCGAGYTYITVNNDGALTPCVCVPYSISNVNRVGLKKAYAELNRYFMSTGNTCYGRRSSYLLPKGQSDMPIPYTAEVSREVMSKCIIRDGNARFYRNVYVDND